MKNANFLIALVIFFVLILGIKSSYYETIEMEKHPAVNEYAVLPDHMLRNASHYYIDYGQRLTTIDYIHKAIDAMKIIEKDMDDYSNETIEFAIMDLEVLIAEFERKEIDERHMQHAFANALNSLALAQLRASEVYQRDSLKEDAENAAMYALEHISNSMYFSDAGELRAERHIYELIEELKKNEKITAEDKRERLHAAVEELDIMLSGSEYSKSIKQ
ncbi:MAG: hypothetical protein ACI8QD_000593 [Cyclobacteriaceae bacterium]|jgi:hypothetical protein